MARWIGWGKGVAIAQLINEDEYVVEEVLENWRSFLQPEGTGETFYNIKSRKPTSRRVTQAPSCVLQVWDECDAPLKNYATVYLPGIGDVKFHNSRNLSLIQDLRTSTVKREGGNWYISMLVNIADVLPDVMPLEKCESIVGIDVGINKLVALSDGSFQENKRIATNKRTVRRMVMRQRPISRKRKGSLNKLKAVKKLAKQQHKTTKRRDGYNWQVASTIVKTADAVAREDLNIKNMSKRAKPKRDGKGGFKRNGASQKTGLNKVILDAGWGEIFNKIAWLALKAGKPVVPVPAKHTSQECPKCGHIDQANREGEKFLCTVCHHTDHADTKASRTIARRVGLVFHKIKKTRCRGLWGSYA